MFIPSHRLEIHLLVKAMSKDKDKKVGGCGELHYLRIKKGRWSLPRSTIGTKYP